MDSTTNIFCKCESCGHELTRNRYYAYGSCLCGECDMKEVSNSWTKPKNKRNKKKNEQECVK